MFAVALLALLVLGLEAGGDSVRLLARFDRPQLGAGQLWRLVSGHLVHLGWGHAVLNVTALALIAAGFGRLYRPWQWFAVGTGAALAIDAGLWFFEPEIGWYVGLSGVLHGMVAAAAVALAATSTRLSVAVFVVLAAKIAWESLAGSLPLTADLSGGDVIVEAHLWGALGGGLAALLIRLLPSRIAPV